MVSGSLRALCAVAAIACFLGGVAGLVVSPSALFVIPMLVAGVLVVPAMSNRNKPTADDLPRIEEHLHRFRGAMLLCFAGAAFVYALVVTGPSSARQLASLGVALWLVAFVLMFFVAYYRTQRRMVTESE